MAFFEHDHGRHYYQDFNDAIGHFFGGLAHV